MISALIVVLIGTSARRGFVRGAPRELVDLLIVALGLPLAFRLGAPIGAALFSDFAPLATRTLGALVVLVVLAIAAIGLRRTLDQGHNELEPAERTLGAVLGTLRAGLVAVVVLAVAAAAPTTSAKPQPDGAEIVDRFDGHRSRWLRHDAVRSRHRRGWNDRPHRVQPHLP